MDDGILQSTQKPDGAYVYSYDEMVETHTPLPLSLCVLSLFVSYSPSISSLFLSISLSFGVSRSLSVSCINLVSLFVTLALYQTLFLSLSLTPFLFPSLVIFLRHCLFTPSIPLSFSLAFSRWFPPSISFFPAFVSLLTVSLACFFCLSLSLFSLSFSFFLYFSLSFPLCSEVRNSNRKRTVLSIRWRKYRSGMELSTRSNCVGLRNYVEHEKAGQELISYSYNEMAETHSPPLLYFSFLSISLSFSTPKSSPSHPLRSSALRECGERVSPPRY